MQLSESGSYMETFFPSHVTILARLNCNHQVVKKIRLLDLFIDIIYNKSGILKREEKIWWQ